MIQLLRECVLCFFVLEAVRKNKQDLKYYELYGKFLMSFFKKHTYAYLEKGQV